MREVIAVCRSGKKSRLRAAKILDRYFWRIGDRTWRGKASNACLDRVSRELRKGATRNTAVVIHEIRSAYESRLPLIRIGSRFAFSEEGLVPVASHPAEARSSGSRSASDRSGLAAVRIAALFHDLGKATVLFQSKLRRALKGGGHEADAVRHELFSAAVWDVLFGKTEDADLGTALGALTAEGVDAACSDVIDRLSRIHVDAKAELPFAFAGRAGSLVHLVGMLVFTHHRLPSGSSNHVTLTSEFHIRPDSPLDARKQLAIAPGTPFWHDPWWLSRLHREGKSLSSGSFCASADIALRASLMFADHLGSALKRASADFPDHLANTIRKDGSRRSDPADSLLMHVRRVYGAVRSAHDLTHRLRDRFPALDASGVPVGVLHPPASVPDRFAWQGAAARAAQAMCSAREGGFFACIMAGTGTGKTRGAPTILASAAMHDVQPERRYFRMSLGLGLRVLAAQSAREYVEDLGFQEGDVSVLVGQEPLRFPENEPDASEGSESLIDLPDWLQVEQAGGRIPKAGDPGEAAWLRSLSLDTERALPALLEMILEHAGRNAANGRRLLRAPVMVGTIDHLMGVAAPVNSRFLLQSLRVMSSDLILDEIDQYDGEDIAAIGRLVFQAAASGRRVIIMSATLTADIAEALETAYRKGWEDHARASGQSPHVNLLLCGDTPGAVFTNAEGGSIGVLLTKCQTALLNGIRAAPSPRRAEILPPCEEWADLVAQIDSGCSRLHDLNAVETDGFRVSVGMVRMTRISHTAALAVQMRSGDLGDRLRLMVCLHSQMPRLHRAFIEARLKRALTRKGVDPEGGLRSLCLAENVFERASMAGVRDIEIVVVTSPVIETGNDLDFDHGILDPISTRSIIQAAGRIRRHRAPGGDQTNVLILGRSPIAMQDGRLAMPGVETRSAAETHVPRCDLSAYKGRHFSDLVGDADFSTVSAAPILAEEIVFPLRDEEAALRRRMVSVEPDAPLGKYVLNPNTRWNRTMTRTRRFRRSERDEMLFCMVGDRLETASWHVDLAPGTKESCLREAEAMQILDMDVCFVFEDLTTSAWMELSRGERDMAYEDFSTLMCVSLQIYGDDARPSVVYHPHVGIVRGSSRDLFEAFGKPTKSQ